MFAFRSQNFFFGNVRKFRSTSRIGLGAIGLGGGAYYFLQSKSPGGTNYVETAYAVRRICNLCVTVAFICVDYGIFVYSRRSTDSELEEMRKELRRAQMEHESYLAEASKAVTPDRVVEAKRKSSEARDKVEFTAISIEHLLEQTHRRNIASIHERSARRLRDLCIVNKGVYVKLGQHLAQLDYLLPKEYISELRCLLASTPPSSIESVRRVIKEDLGLYPEEIWTVFEEAPIASASLAQVHVAYDAAGKKYAVKVQHEGLLNSSKGDMLAITFVVHLVKRLFKDFSYLWLVREMNRNVPMELNFLVEKANLDQCRVHLKRLIDSGDVVVPEVYQVSPRVICMSFESGVHISDASIVKAHGMDPAEVARLVSSTFCEQM